MKPTIRLVLPDGNVFVVPEQIVYLFPALGPHINKDLRCVWLTEFNVLLLPQVIEWANHHLDKNDLSIADPQQFIIAFDDWDFCFLKTLHPISLIELIVAAHFLGNKHLRNLAGRVVANFIRESTVEQNEFIFGPGVNELLENIMNMVQQL